MRIRYKIDYEMIVAIYVASWATTACTSSKYLDEVNVEVPPGDGFAFVTPTQVTAGNESSFAPDLSPNGAYVVYTSDRSGNKDLWEKNSTGGFGQPLTIHAADDFSPVYSPDGTRIAFVSRREDAAGDIHIKTLGFSFSKLLHAEGDTAVISSKATEDTMPAWFPDGDRIVYAARQPGQKHAALMIADLDDMKSASLGNLSGEQPAVAPDGKSIAFVRDGALFLYDLTKETTQQLTDGGRVQDGQPRFILGGKSLLFIRYADDTNGDDQLNGDDHPTVWRLDLERQKAAAIRENYFIEPLTSAKFAAFSPQMRPPFLYMALQTNEGLDIFRLPDFGQIRPVATLDQMLEQVDQLADSFDKTLVLRRAQTALTLVGEEDQAAEAALAELAWHVQNGRRIEAEWTKDKLRANYASHAGLVALAELAIVRLDLQSLYYPKFNDSLEARHREHLQSLAHRVSEIVSALPAQDQAMARRVSGRALLLEAQILAAQRQFFDANERLAQLANAYGDDRKLAAEAAHYRALITPATSDIDTAIRAFRSVVEAYPENKQIVRQSAEDAVSLLAGREDYVESLVALRTEAKGLPVLPALAHMRISEHYMTEKKPAVAANELRQLVDLYPESPEVVLEAAKRLSILEEQDNRYDAAAAMLKQLVQRMQAGKPEHAKAARDLLVVFLLRRAEGLMKQKEFALAVKEYDKVIAIKPLSMSAHRGLIDANYQLGEIENISTKYQKEAQKEGGSAERLYFYGYALTYQIDATDSVQNRLGAIDAAIAVLEDARQINAQIMHIHQTLGWLYLQKGYWQRKYYESGTMFAGLSKRLAMVGDFWGSGDPHWLELGIDAFQTAYFLAGEGSFERAGLAQNLGQTYYELKNYQKSLAYYMQRIKQLDLIPMRDERAEGVLWRRAGRSAFQTEELELAESLQRSALKVWEKINDDVEIAYSIDALALTVRERGRFKEAIALYERLQRIHERLEDRVNLVGTLSNLGFSAFMDGQSQIALRHFDAAERELALLQSQASLQGDADQKSEANDAIKVDLGDQGSAAKGFDLFARQNLILTFRGRIYEQTGRLDLALASYKRKLEILQAQRIRLIDEEGASEEALAEDIAILQNNIGQILLAGGYHREASVEFAAAIETARRLRPDGQAYMAGGELTNAINHARVQLRLAKLELLSGSEIEQTTNMLDQSAEALRPVYLQGAKSEGQALAEMVALSSSLKAVGAGQLGTEKLLLERNARAFEESLDILQQAKVKQRSYEGALLAYSSAVGDAENVPRLVELKKMVDELPDLEWRLFAAQQQWEKAFEALDRYIYGGGRLKSPTDRLAARVIFEGLVEHVSQRSDDRALILLLRRYLLMRHTDLVLRSWPVEVKVPVSDLNQGLGGGASASIEQSATNSDQLSPKDGQIASNFHKEVSAKEIASKPGATRLEVPRSLQKVLTLKGVEDIQNALDEHDAILLLHRLMKGSLLAVAISKTEMAAAITELTQTNGKKLTREAVEQGLGKVFLRPEFVRALPSAGGRLYLVPSAELYDLAMEDVNLADSPLHQRFSLAFLPNPDVLPALKERRNLPKSSVGLVAGHKPLSAKDLEALRSGNASRDFSPITMEEGAPLATKLAEYNIVHIAAPLLINDVVPAQSVLAVGDGTQADAYVYDLTLKQLADLDLAHTSLLVLANAQHVNRDLSGSVEGHDGWVLVSLAAASAGVSSVVSVDTSQSRDRSPNADLPQQVAMEGAASSGASKRPADWQDFYSKLADMSVAEAVQVSRLPGRVIGYAGASVKDELAYAEETLEATIEEAEEAEDEAAYAEAASAYKRVLYFLQRLGEDDQAGEMLGRIVDVLYQARDYLGALHFKKKVAARLKPNPIEQGGADSGNAERSDAAQAKDPFEYATAILDAAVLAVRGLQFQEAEQLLVEAEAIFKEEEENGQLGKIWHYRGINFENQKAYERTIDSYKASREFYLSANPEQAAARLLDIGNIYRNNLSDYTAALEYYDLAIEEFKKLDKRDAYLPVLIDKANTLMAIGDLERAINLLERTAIPAIDKERQRVWWVRATQILANAYYRAGVYQEASDLNDQAFQESQGIPALLIRVDRQIDAMGLRGMVLAKLGQYKEAFQVFREAIALATEYKLKGQIALLYNNYGFWVREYGHIDQSIDFFNIALKIDEELKSRSAIAYDQRNLGLSVALKGDFNRARDLLSQALRTSEELNLSYNTAYCYFGLGDVAMREQKWDEAAKAFAQALSLSERGYMQDFIWRAHAGIAAVALQRERWEEAETHYKAATKVIESLRAGLKSEASRNAFLSDAGVQEVYEGYAVTLMATGQVESAWQVSERARARAFIDSIGTQKLKFAREESAKLVLAERELKSAIEAAERRASYSKQRSESRQTTQTQSQNSRDGELASLQGEYAELLAKMRVVDQQLIQFVAVEAVTKEELAALLPTDTALVQYLATKDRLLVWVVRNGRVSGSVVGVSRRDLQTRIRDFRLLMQNFSTPDYLGKELSEILLSPIESDIAGAKRLAIVPHQNLHFFPFAALPYHDQYLIEHFAVYYLDSATTARFADRPSQSIGEEARILALANPKAAAKNVDLPFAEREVEVLSRYFPQVARVKGEDASEARVKQGIDAYDVLHIAAHGDFKPITPGESTLALAAGNGQDGQLSVNEVFGLKGKVDLVTLSACDSGLGRLSSGDEIIGFNRAFFYAGADTVVSSLWRINDVTSAVVIKRFYRYLSEGLDKAEAMRRAQLVVRRYHPHPAYWSAFKVAGDWQ